MLAGGESFSVLSAHLHSSHAELGVVGAVGCEFTVLPVPCFRLSTFWAPLPTDFTARLPTVWGRIQGSSLHYEKLCSGFAASKAAQQEPHTHLCKLWEMHVG